MALKWWEVHRLSSNVCGWPVDGFRVGQGDDDIFKKMFWVVL